MKHELLEGFVGIPAWWMTFHVGSKLSYRNLRIFIDPTDAEWKRLDACRKLLSLLSLTSETE